VISSALILAVGCAAFFLFKLCRLHGSAVRLGEKTKALAESTKKTSLALRKKIIRPLLLQKAFDNEPVPTITFAKSGKSAPILFPWESIYATAQDEGFGLTGTCEGNGDCGLCAIAVISGKENLSPPTPAEESLLKKLDLPAGARLSCQSRAKGDIVIDFL
jgi:ferredoxin